jgi:hypothetical protein
MTIGTQGAHGAHDIDGRVCVDNEQALAGVKLVDVVADMTAGETHAMMLCGAMLLCDDVLCIQTLPNTYRMSHSLPPLLQPQKELLLLLFMLLLLVPLEHTQNWRLWP